MIIKLALALSIAFALGCGDSEKAARTPAEITDPAAAEAVKNGARRVDVAITKNGYEPASIPAKPGETLVLVFSRPADLPTCASPLTIEGQPGEIEVPEGGTAAATVTIPEGASEIGFACTMDMVKGVITIN